MRNRLKKCAALRGMLMLELLISISVVALLMTALSAAFVATVQAMQTNDDFTRAAHAARTTVQRVTRDIRTSDACQVGTAAQQSAARVEASRMDVVNDSGQSIRYEFDTTARTLTASTDGGPEIVLVRQVDGKFISTLRSGTSGLRVTSSVAMELNVGAGKQVLRLSGSASPRRVLQ